MKYGRYFIKLSIPVLLVVIGLTGAINSFFVNEFAYYLSIGLIILGIIGFLFLFFSKISR
ncbi:hypothetical protein [Alkalihalobacillus sp. AL-G]|uniref:hypothetical protein n=1 Tax=Alkalihalobacillus sp. AL-G TaxID=2926399 RepID=UPI00272A3C53|nr:hypothetical protein [Alkalihalobacillus sp. AL-G]WLD92619.1 hypothetical protein MOJ78_16610 [Alkalihalobacillus sp. AL-G]